MINEMNKWLDDIYDFLSEDLVLLESELKKRKPKKVLIQLDILEIHCL